MKSNQDTQSKPEAGQTLAPTACYAAKVCKHYDQKYSEANCEVCGEYFGYCPLCTHANRTVCGDCEGVSRFSNSLPIDRQYFNLLATVKDAVSRSNGDDPAMQILINALYEIHEQDALRGKPHNNRICDTGSKG